jgi:hypothetical protein
VYVPNAGCNPVHEPIRGGHLVGPVESGPVYVVRTVSGIRAAGWAASCRIREASPSESSENGRRKLPKESS